MKTVYDLRQDEIVKSMKDLSRSERDSVLTIKMFAELKNQNFSKTNDRMILEYTESFGNEQKKICEDCFITLYKQKSKRTYESWKSSLKRSILFDAAAADIQSSLAPKRKQKNW